MMMRVIGAALVACLSGTGAAAASIWVTNGVAGAPAIRVDRAGNAEVSWLESGSRRTLLVPPSGRVLPGGRLVGTDVSRRTSRTLVAMARVVKRTPDGYFWALQEWVRTPGERPELRLARWRGAPTKLTLVLSGNQLSGEARFGGRPVAGFTTSPAGRRLRIRVYVDCWGCPGARGGWKRMLGVAPRPDGTFNASIRPEWRGSRYRATVTGPNRGLTRAPDARTIAAS